MTLYFADTNFFLECRKAPDLPWHEIEKARGGPRSDVSLIVPSTVITEIERHKAKGNSRTAKRARYASSLLRKALTSPGHVFELRATDPRVLLELPPVLKVDFSKFPNLDPTRADHRIAAEYAEVLKIKPELIVLTDDTLLTLAVRSLGFEPLLIPESWKLAPEKDERDDEINRLRKEVRAYRETSPDMSVAVLDSNDKEVTIVTTTIDVFKPSTEEIEHVVASMQVRFPLQREFVPSQPQTRPLYALNSLWHPPTKEEIDRYKRKSYPEWVNSVRKALPMIVARLNEVSCEIPFQIQILNTGFANASQIRLTVSAYDGLMLLGSLSDEAATKRREALSLPSAPQAPRGHHIPAFPNWPTAGADIPIVPILHPDLLMRRDPNKFYYTEGGSDTPADELELTCEAFPHQGDPYNLSFRIVIPYEGTRKQGRLRVRLQASNLRQPIERFIPVSISFQRGDFLQRLGEITDET